MPDSGSSALRRPTALAVLLVESPLVCIHFLVGAFEEVVQIAVRQGDADAESDRFREDAAVIEPLELFLDSLDTGLGARLPVLFGLSERRREVLAS